MRTTVPLEPETERLLKQAMRRRGQSFKEALNHTVLAGLAELDGPIDESAFKVDSAPMRSLAGHDPAHLNRLSDELEAQAFVDLTLRLQDQSDNR